MRSNVIARSNLKNAQGLHWVARLRYGIGPWLARIASAIGIPWDVIGQSLIRRASLLAQVRSISPTKVIDSPRQPLDIIFATFMGNNTRLVSVDIILGRALAAKGHKVRFVICDQMLPMCEVKGIEREQQWDKDCAECYHFGLRYLIEAGFEVIPLSELCSSVVGEEDFETAEYVDSALLKHYRVGVLASDSGISQRKEHFKNAALISYRAGRNIALMKPDRVIMTHGIYCTWGPARQVLEEQQIPLVSTAEGKKRDTMKFNWTTSADWWDVSKEWELVKDKSLTPEQDDQIERYLQSRRSHSEDARVYNFGSEEAIDDTWRRLGLDSDKQTFLLFTNVLWDAASTSREIAFDNPVAWVFETIQWFVEHPEKQLVVKIHPAEVVIGTNQPFAKLIKSRFPVLPANVRVIEPNEKVNSWSILRIADLGLVHTSTVGMELPLEYVPCAVVSRTHFRDRGFTIDVDTKSEYFELLNSWDGSKIDLEHCRTLAKRYSYILFERYQLPFPFTVEPLVNQVSALKNVSEEELLSHPTIKIFIESLEGKSEFLVPV